MVFSAPPAAKRPKLGNVAIDSEGKTMGQYRQDARDQNAEHKHSLKYGFLSDIMDQEGRRPEEKDYDDRRLHVPKSSLEAMTNFERQYWEIKMMNWDTVLFFKKGKFYELYERDADIGCQNFDLKMTDSARSSMRMVGIPEQNFNLWAARFIGAGHKVGRVEQMQTRGQLDRSGSTQTVVPRELTQLLTLGTLTELEMLMDHKPNYLVAIKEMSSSYGVVVADTSRGVFRLAYFGEDDTRSSLVTLLHSTKPKEIIMERGRLSKVALACIDKELGSKVRKTVLTPGTEYPDKAKAIEYFEEAGFFPTKPVTGELASFWDNDLVMSAFGAMAFYLRDSKQDKELLSMNNFGKYDPAHGGAALVLDGTTLANLEILESATGRGAKGTLLAHVNHAESAAGKRLLHDWICTPLRDVDAIILRQGAVEELVKAPERRQRFQRFLAKLPDLERNLSRLGIACRERDVAWVDPVAYNKKIVELFTRTLTSLRDIHVFVTGLAGDACTSELLKSLLTFKKAGGCFPHFIDVLDAFEGSFDHAAAMESGEVIPNSGKHEEYDRCVAQIAGTNEQLNAMLKDVRKHYRDPKIKWADFGKERYLVEVPTSTVNATKAYPSLELKSANKQVTRFFFNRPDARKLIDKALSLKDEEDAVKRRVLKDVLSQFGDNAALWKATVGILANVDCLCSLAQASSVPGWTKPVVRVRAEGEKPSFKALGVTHPLVRPAVGARIDTIVANDMCLGGDEPPVSLITGPNMGGKSTAMRSACVVIILAQMGCYVPCQSLDMTAVDRIFTRIGACDRILSGLSTFMVEMRETSCILKSATQDSFVVLDELGRGTATVDGYSIAHAVLLDIAQRLKCRTMFSTHYHFLCHDVLTMATGEIGLYRMAYEIDPVTRAVKFLYKYSRGATTDSYGVDVAKKANIANSILDKAQEKSTNYRSVHTYRGENMVERVAHLAREALQSRDPVRMATVKRKASELLTMQ